MEGLVPKRVFTFLNMKPNENIYEVGIILAAGDGIYEFEAKPRI